MAVTAVRVKGGVQVQFNGDRVGFVRQCDVEKLAYLLLKLSGEAWKRGAA